MGQKPACVVCCSPFHRKGGLVVMVMQYFSRIAHIDLQRRKRPSRSEKKMCMCVFGWAALGVGVGDEPQKKKDRRRRYWGWIITRWLLPSLTHTVAQHVTCTMSSLHSFVISALHPHLGQRTWHDMTACVSVSFSAFLLQVFKKMGEGGEKHTVFPWDTRKRL